MTDYELLKQTFQKIGLNFVSSQTLIGFSILVSTETKELYYEFDYEGNFIRII